jgi:hypothetical protein
MGEKLGRDSRSLGGGVRKAEGIFGGAPIPSSAVQCLFVRQVVAQFEGLRLRRSFVRKGREVVKK